MTPLDGARFEKTVALSCVLADDAIPLTLNAGEASELQSAAAPFAPGATTLTASEALNPPPAKVTSVDV